MGLGRYLKVDVGVSIGGAGEFFSGVLGAGVMNVTEFGIDGVKSSFDGV